MPLPRSMRPKSGITINHEIDYTGIKSKRQINALRRRAKKAKVAEHRAHKAARAAARASSEQQAEEEKEKEDDSEEQDDDAEYQNVDIGYNGDENDEENLLLPNFDALTNTVDNNEWAYAPRGSMTIGTRYESFWFVALTVKRWDLVRAKSKKRVNVNNWGIYTDAEVDFCRCGCWA